MNSTPPLPSADQRPPTMAQLFGTSYEDAYIRHLPEQVTFSQPVCPRLDIGRTKRLAMRLVHNYDLQLQAKYPKTPGKRARPEYSKRRLNSGCTATLDAMFEMYSGYLNAIKEGARVQCFSVSPSGIASRRYKAVVSMNTIGEHLERLEAAGLFKSSYDAKKQKYDITWNRDILAALPDRFYRDQLAKMIVEKCPDLENSEDFAVWLKGLNPSFFACSSPPSPQFLSMYLLKQEPNSNTHQRNFVNVGETKFPATPPSKQEHGSTAPVADAHASTAALGAKNSSAGPVGQKQNIASGDEVLDFHVESAFKLAIGTLSMWWYDKIKVGGISEQQINTAKLFIRYWLQQDYVKIKLSYRDYIDRIFLPTLYNQRSALLKLDYGWIPYLHKYFDPQWHCNDGSPAGYVKATLKLEELQEKFKKQKKLMGTREKLKKAKAREAVFSKQFFFVMRNPSEKNYMKAEQQIRLLKDKNLLDVFIKSIQSAKLLTRKFMSERSRIAGNKGV